MASISRAFAANKRLEDPLEYLPCSKVVEFRKGEVIYDADQPSTAIYLVIEGRVAVSQLQDRRQVMVDVYRHDDFFGESALLNLPQQSERATALEDTKLMIWSSSEIEDLLMKRPGLALALLQIFVERMRDFTDRIQSLSVNTIPQRLAHSLVRFSLRMGTPGEGGSVRMAPLTHEMLAEYLGTSRELVSHYMNHFRKKGYLQYSRKEILIYQNAWQKWSV
jgi:CRP/FNR family cyclic AMP-dependent transcriptional regulator